MDYQAFLKDWLKTQPKAGHGIARQLAASINVSTALISQILHGTRHFQPEQALQTAEYLQLPPLERDYFLLLVQRQRSGDHKYVRYADERLAEIRAKANQLKERLIPDTKISEEIKARYFSHWMYSALRLATDLPNKNTAPSLARFLKLPLEQVRGALEFLVNHGFCSEHDGRYSMSTSTVLLDSNSPWVLTRQIQWRQKAFGFMDSPDSKNLFYTGQFVISEEDASFYRERMLQLIQEFASRARESKSENFFCLNLDWFSLRE